MNYVAFKNSNRNWSPLSDLRREMDKLFDDFWAVPTTNKSFQDTEAQWSPACDVEEGEGYYLISLEMAGVPKDQIKVEFQDNQIVISGERRQVTLEKDKGQWYSERRFGKFQRSFSLPIGIEPDKVEAHYQDGVLKVYIPKAESAKPRQIKITQGSSQGLLDKLLSSAKKEKEGNYLSGEMKSEIVA